MTVSDMKPGEVARVISVSSGAPSRLRLMDLGILPGTQVKLLRPRLLSVFGVSYCLAEPDAAAVFVRKAGDTP